MRAGEMTPPVELIPARRQILWGWQAVVNFTAGGVGAGLYGAAVIGAGFERTPAVALASWLAPFLVLAGFAAVAGEAGRPPRGPRVRWGDVPLRPRRRRIPPGREREPATRPAQRRE